MRRINFHFLILTIFALLSCAAEENHNPPEDCLDLVIDMDRFENLVKDPTTSVQNATIEDDCLVLNLHYTGGCEDHHIELVSDGSVAESFPPQMWFAIHHDNTDPCDALIQAEWKFSLEVLADTVGEVVIHLDGWNESIHYIP